MAKHMGAFKADKRKKELARLQKQEEKRQRRIERGSDESRLEEVVGGVLPEEAGEAKASEENDEQTRLPEPDSKP